MKTPYKRYNTKNIEIIQGEIIVNSVWITKQTPNIILLTLDLRSKRCDISYHYCNSGSWGLTLWKNEYTVHAHPTLTNQTEIFFNNLNSKYWSIFCAENSKYTINVCLIKK